MAPTPVFLFENSHGQRSLSSSWSCKQSDMTERAGTAESCLITPTNTTLRMDYIPNKTVINLTHELNYLLYSYHIYCNSQWQWTLPKAWGRGNHPTLLVSKPHILTIKLSSDLTQLPQYEVTRTMKQMSHCSRQYVKTTVISHMWEWVLIRSVAG